MASLRRKLSNIIQLGLKELRSLYRDPAMLVLIIYSFTLAIYEGATAVPEAPHRASIAVVDEDRSQASLRIVNAFQLPSFTLNIPPNFQADLLAGRQPAIQLNVDATQVSQAFTGAGQIQQIIASETAEFVRRYRSGDALPVEAVVRTAFNPNLNRAWFGAVNEVINQITMLAIILTGAALIREREHGTIEHLLVMPVTPFEIMVGKVWAMGLVVLVAAAFALRFVVEGWLDIPIQGSLLLFAGGAALHLFAATSMGIFFGTVARSMPQLGLLVILTLIPLQILSGGVTPRESMPALIQHIMLAAPTTHFVELAQAILFRGAGVSVIWPQLLALLVIGAVFFLGALSRLRQSLR